MTATVDFLVAGDDEASLAAAAAAAKSGARVALLRPPKRGPRIPPASFSAVPNFIWRRFDLHEYGLSLEPASARVTLAARQAVTTFAGVRRTQASLADAGVGDHLLWTAFVEDMAGLEEAAVMNGAAAGASNGADAFPSLFHDARRLSALAKLTDSCESLLGDYFCDADLKTHVGAHALSRAGLGGREAGSALALPEFFAEDAWPVRIAEGGPSLRAVLEKVCAQCGVTMLEGALLDIAADGDRRSVTLTGDQRIKTQFIFFATPEAAQAAGAATSSLSPLGLGGQATAVMRLTLKEELRPPAGDDKAVFQIADDFAELQTARDAAADGRLPERPPVEFEITADGDIIARTAYCPAAFRTEDGLRGWTGQDRQAIAARMKERLASRLDGLAGKIVKTEVKIIGADETVRDARLPDDENIIIQPNRHNAVAAAVRLVDKALHHG